MIKRLGKYLTIDTFRLFCELLAAVCIATGLWLTLPSVSFFHCTIGALFIQSGINFNAIGKR